MPAISINLEKISMFEEIIISHFHPGYNIGLQNIRSAWLLVDPPVKLKTTIYRGSLIYRIPGSGKRVSYRKLKKGLQKKQIIIREELNLLPF